MTATYAIVWVCVGIAFGAWGTSWIWGKVHQTLMLQSKEDLAFQKEQREALEARVKELQDAFHHEHERVAALDRQNRDLRDQARRVADDVMRVVQEVESRQRRMDPPMRIIDYSGLIGGSTRNPRVAEATRKVKERFLENQKAMTPPPATLWDHVKDED